MEQLQLPENISIHLDDIIADIRRNCGAKRIFTYGVLPMHQSAELVLLVEVNDFVFVRNQAYDSYLQRAYGVNTCVIFTGDVEKFLSTLEGIDVYELGNNSCL